MVEEQLTRPQLVHTCKPSMDEEQLTRPQIVHTCKHEYGRGTVNSTSDSAYR